MSDWKPDFPYIKFSRKSARKVYRNEHNQTADKYEPDVTYFRVTGCHINQESIRNVRANGWNRIMEYGNFDKEGNFVEGTYRGRKPEYAKLAAWIEVDFATELDLERERKEKEAAKPEPVAVEEPKTVEKPAEEGIFAKKGKK